MVTLHAHFDGKVLVPDVPLALRPNQKVRITIEPADGPVARTDFSEWLGLAADGTQRPHDPADEDALWRDGPLSRP